MEEDCQQVEGHRVVLTSDWWKMENICKFYKFGYCKLRDQCEKNHVKEECKDGSHCKAIKICVLRHPKMCKRFVFEGICGFGDMCSYNHKKVLNQHGSDKD